MLSVITFIVLIFSSSYKLLYRKQLIEHDAMKGEFKLCAIVW